jgi:hypothetical protein
VTTALFGASAGFAAGFTYEFVPKQIGFVCQIDGFPDPCNGAPASAYWSLWAGEDGDWVYSTTGSVTLRTPVDTIVAWSFGAGDPPPLPVPELAQAAAQTTTASPTTKTADPKQTPDAAGERTGPLGTVIAALLVVTAGLATDPGRSGSPDSASNGQGPDWLTGC